MPGSFGRLAGAGVGTGWGCFRVLCTRAALAGRLELGQEQAWGRGHLAGGAGADVG